MSDPLRIVQIKFRPAGRRYDFNARDFDLQKDDRVIVETERGRALGTVINPPRETTEQATSGELKKVLRKATDEDLALAQANTTREEDAYRFCMQRIAERKMEMKLVQAEYLFDGSKIIFYFTADGRVDFRELVKDLAHHFHTRIEMRQIGVRDEAKLAGGMGICGRELCCCSWLTEFNPVSVKMAKEQGLALNPNKISGQCGRLLCCLAYEFETYCEMKQGLPKTGKKITLPGLKGEVVDQNVLYRKITVQTEEGKRVEVTAEELEQGRKSDQASRPSDPGGKQAPRGGGGDSAEKPKPAATRQEKSASDEGGQDRKPESGRPRKRRSRGRRRPRRK